MRKFAPLSAAAKRMSISIALLSTVAQVLLVGKLFDVLHQTLA